MKKQLGIRPYSKRELAALYEVPTRSFYTMFKPHESKIGNKLGRYYSTKQIEILFRELGLPPCMLPDQLEVSEENKLNQNVSSTSLNK